ncbi:MAG: hypothetical protein GY699_18285 [Desulfobacteraceae bacterium]|nr:hypothetical protein [Desulfobacteraceae bacterium]
MARIMKKVPILFPIILFAALVFCGCEGSEPREKVDDTVKELSGQKNVERMKQMKKDINVIQDQQEDRQKQLEESADK